MNWILGAYETREFKDSDKVEGVSRKGRYGPFKITVEYGSVTWIAGNRITCKGGYISIDRRTKQERFVCFDLAANQTFSLHQGQKLFSITTEEGAENFRLFSQDGEFMPDTERLEKIVPYVEDMR